jgi:hypothetical protein
LARAPGAQLGEHELAIAPAVPHQPSSLRGRAWSSAKIARGSCDVSMQFGTVSLGRRHRSQVALIGTQDGLGSPYGRHLGQRAEPTLTGTRHEITRTALRGLMAPTSKRLVRDGGTGREP